MTQTPENQQQYGSILTILGENAEQNGKLQNKQITFTHMAIGDANDEYVQPDRKQTALVNELARIPVNSVDVLQPTPDSVPMLKVEAILPDDVNDLVIREFAAVATFDGNTYFHAVGNNARIYVPPPVNNGNVNTPVTLEMIFVITSADPIVEMDPNVVTASRSWVDAENKRQAVMLASQSDYISGTLDSLLGKSIEDKQAIRVVNYPDNNKDTLLYIWPKPNNHSEIEQINISGLEIQFKGDVKIYSLLENAAGFKVKSLSGTINRLLAERFDQTINVKDNGAVGGGEIDDSDAIETSILNFRAAITLGLHPKLEFPFDKYKCKKVWNLSKLGTAQSSIDGNGSEIIFEELGGKPALVDCVDSKELYFNDIKLRYPGDTNRPPEECPEIGLLFARNAANDYSGRHKLYNVTIGGTFTIAPHYNSGCEENCYYHVEFRNGLKNQRAYVLTCSNHLGARSEFSTITTTKISTTLNTLVKPVFWTNGSGVREAVCIRGAGGVTLLNPYSSSGGVAHYCLQAIDQTISAVDIIGYQAEVDRGEDGTNAQYVVRLEGVDPAEGETNTKLDVISINIKEQLTSAIDGMLIDNIRDMKRSVINMGRLVRDSGSPRAIKGCDIKSSEGVTLTSVESVTGCEIYTELSANIKLPSNTKSTTLRADDLDAEVSVGTIKQKNTASNISLDAKIIRLSGGGDVVNFSSEYSSLPYAIQKFYIENLGTPAVIKHGVGNIRTSTAQDITLSGNSVAEVTYYGVTGQYLVTVLG